MEASAFFAAIGFATCCYGLWRWRLVTRISRWSRTSGTIVRLHEGKRVTGEVGAYFVPRVAATYEVEGATFTTTRFSIHNFTIGMPGEIRELLRGVSVGDTVEVFFDPDYPQRSILARPSREGALVALFLGLLLLSLVLAISLSS